MDGRLGGNGGGSGPCVAVGDVGCDTDATIGSDKKRHTSQTGAEQVEGGNRGRALLPQLLCK